MSTSNVANRFTALPDEGTLATMVIALKEHGFGVDIDDTLEAVRNAALARIPRAPT